MAWCLLVSIFLSSSFALMFFLKLLFRQPKLPPGPATRVPFFGNLQWLFKSFLDLETHLRGIRSKYGPIFTFPIGPRSIVFISDRSLAHKALVQKGSVFSDRPPATPLSRIFTNNQHSISSAGYGPLWRLLRRNLMSETLHPARIKSFAGARRWVLQILIERLRTHAGTCVPVPVLETLRYAMFYLLLLMCFGQKLDEKAVKEIQGIHRYLLGNFAGINVLSVLPAKIGSLLFRKRWNGILKIREKQEELLIPLIRERASRDHQNEEGFQFTYVDSLLGLELPDEGGRRLTEGEMVTLCTEFLNAGSDTTSTAMQWVMANVVKDRDVQRKLAEEVERILLAGKEEVMIIREEDLNEMPYLKAVVMEALRRHPPAAFLLPHAVSAEGAELEGYVIPKGIQLNFMVREVGRDERAWEEPGEFRPERFMVEGGERGVDIITGSKEIKMMPFGAGRRICPGLNLAMLHMEYFVANFVREFEWKSCVEGEEVDLTEKLEFFRVMKKPLMARVIRRRRELC